MLWLVCLALASDTNYQNYVTGGRAVGLGGAFTALGNDPAGILYNPAGLIDDRHTDVTVSANLYGFERTNRGQAIPSPFPDLRNIGQVATELVIIPSMSGIVRTFQKDPNGGYLNAISAGVLVPSFRSSVEQVDTIDADGNSVDYKRRVQDRLLQPGIAYARKLSERWRIGISTMFVLRTVDANENIVSSQLGDPSPFRMADSTLSLSAGSLMWNFGVKCLVSDHFQLGLSFAPPSLPVFTATSLRYYRGGFTPNPSPGEPQSEFTPIVEDNLPSQYITPATLRFGGVYQSPKNFTIAADVSMHFPIHYDLIRVPEARKAQLRSVLPIPTEIERQMVVNLNLGAEWHFVPNVSVAAGFFTDFASSPSLAGPAFEGALDRQYLANVDYYGFTAALGFHSPFTLTRIGASYSFGKGYDVVTRDNFGRLLDSEVQFERVPQAKSFLYIFVSSTVRFE